MDKSTLRAQLRQLEDKLYKACDQLVLIERKMQDMTIRLNRAIQDGNRSMRYNRRLHIITLEGVRAAFYVYAETAADKITELRCQLEGDEILLRDDPYDSDYSD